MRISFTGTLLAFVCIFAPLALPLQSLADDSSAAKVNAITWGNMNQVMAGISTKTPDELTGPLKILTPRGLYVIIDAHFLYGVAARVPGVAQDEAFTNYLNFILSQPGVAGLLFAAPWGMLNPEDPAVKPPATAYNWTSLDDALSAVSAAGKTLQVSVTAGANSPGWLFQAPHLSSCDFLFSSSIKPPTKPSDCGYTKIFTDPPTGPLPLPWSSNYKSEWKKFLQELMNHIKMKGGDSYVVSLDVAGPTLVSGEMILPRKLASPLPAGYSTPVPASPHGSPANAAWNCLLANNYGTTYRPATVPYYLNSDRAFIEEWAAAIDAYGEIFSGLTLTVSTGNALPDFTGETGGTVTCDSEHKFPTAAPVTIAPPPAFAPDCDVRSPHKTLFPMDCAAETAILAYFAEPSVGGPNAKATQEDALAASDDVVATLLTLSNAGVKWLSQITAGGLAPVSGNVSTPGSSPVMSRMLGGLQFNGFVFNSLHPNQSATRSGCPYLGCPGCLASSGGVHSCEATMTKCTTMNVCAPIAPYCAPKPGSGAGCTLLSPGNAAPVEQGLLNTLQAYFAGTSATTIFAAPATIMDNGTTVKDAPLNYLQMWFPDFEYAAGWGNCDRTLIMANTLTNLMTNANTICSKYTPPASMPKVCISPSECGMNAQGLLALAGAHIPTTPVALPLFGYNDLSMNKMCECLSGYVKRGAFDNDDVCVSPTEKTQAQTENKTSNFVTNESKNGVPYGPCSPGLHWRQANMGDYVCATPARASQVAAENNAGKSHSTCH